MKTVETQAKKLAVVLLAFMVLLLALPPLTAHAEESEAKTIRVAFPTQEGMIIRTKWDKSQQLFH